jgi:hypothetical protein
LPHASHIFPTDQTERTRDELLAFLTGTARLARYSQKPQRVI